jgi:hypothetical protein
MNPMGSFSFMLMVKRRSRLMALFSDKGTQIVLRGSILHHSLAGVRVDMERGKTNILSLRMCDWVGAINSNDGSVLKGTIEDILLPFIKTFKILARQDKSSRDRKKQMQV